MSLQKRSAGRRTVFDLRQKKEDLLKLEHEAQSSDFWSNQGHARRTTSLITELKDAILFWERFSGDVSALKELISVAEGELPEELSNQAGALEKEFVLFERKLFFSGKYDGGSAIITIYAGAGGDDAEDWARILLEMYERYAFKKGWNVKRLHIHPNEFGGIKNASLYMDGKYAYGYLKGEFGVHRLVRISPFDSNKRRHTSFALVEVLPEIEDTEEIAVKDEDVEISFSRSSGPGGQNVNKRETAVRITHKPTGITVHASTERTQQANRKHAMNILRARLYELMRAKTEEERARARGGSLPQNEWGSQIRSYVFHPYHMVKDHRTGAETSDVEKVLNGYLDKFIEAELTLKLT